MDWSANWSLGWQWLDPDLKDNFCEYARGLLVGLPTYWIAVIVISPIIGTALVIIYGYEKFKMWQYYRVMRLFDESIPWTGDDWEWYRKFKGYKEKLEKHVGFWSIAWEFIKTMKHRVCPVITFSD